MIPEVPQFTSVGDVLLDVSLRRGARRHDAAARVRAGGTSANAAAWAAAAGASSRCIGRVGDDLAGRALRQALERRGVEARLTVDPSLPTGVAAEVDGELAVDRGANAVLCSGDLQGLLEADAVLVSGYLLLHDDTAAVAGEALRDARAGWLAVDAGARLAQSRTGLDRAGLADALFLDGGAGRADDPEGAAQALAGRHRLVCVTLGAAGAVGVLDGRTARAEPPAVHPGEAPGAGDAFAAGVLVALADGATLQEALARGCELGAAAAASPDGWPPLG